MNRQMFLEELKQQLKANRVPDIDEIIAEYADHFLHKAADGYTEEEIVNALGDAKELARAYASDGKIAESPARLPRLIGLGLADVLIMPLFLLALVWVAALAIAVLAFVFAGAWLIISPSSPARMLLLPHMPYLPGALLGAGILALGGLFGVLTVQCFLLVKKLWAAFLRWHRSVQTGRKLPPYVLFPLVEGKAKRRLRRVALACSVMFAVCFTAAYAWMAFAAGNFEFWHVWRWFQYAG
ncbi:MAG: DUF1700 domain-containing protein [Candidatus Pelethousia sp.]|nr:DUF1700 domain-containing protein [Candidatus Pelethousia sp.]